jgi:hypothetical protein
MRSKRSDSAHPVAVADAPKGLCFFFVCASGASQLAEALSSVSFFRSGAGFAGTVEGPTSLRGIMYVFIMWSACVGHIGVVGIYCVCMLRVCMRMCMCWVC